MNERRHPTNQFYFDAEKVRLFASAMDYRPFLAPTGWVLYFKGADEWEIAEYGVAYSELAAQIHAEEAKGRYLRKTYYGGRYMRELHLKERAELRKRISNEAWMLRTFDTECLVEPIGKRKAPYELRVSLLEKRDRERWEILKKKQRITVPKKSKQRAIVCT